MSIKRRSRNGAFLIELLTVIAIFAVCAAACVRVIGIAASEMKYAERLSDAQIKTADIAECYKSGESISELSQRYADGDIRIQLSERTSGNIQRRGRSQKRRAYFREYHQVPHCTPQWKSAGGRRTPERR